MSRFSVQHRGEIKVASNKDHQPIRLVKGPPGFSPFVVQGSVWQGNLRVSIRQHFHPKDNPELLLPTKKGLDLVPELARTIAQAIYEVLEEMKQETPPQDPLVEAGLALGATIIEKNAVESEEEIPF